MRKIVLMRPREWLTEASTMRSMDITQSALESEASLTGARVPAQGYPVRVPVVTRRVGVSLEDDEYVSPLGHNFSVALEFDNDDAENEFLERNADTVEGVFADPQISTFPVTCPGSPVGTSGDVLNKVNIAGLHGSGATGRGAKVVVVDTGIDGTQINVVGGYSPRPGAAPGTSPPDHGTMVAFDALIAAPDAMIFDYALLQSSGNTWVAFLSDGIRAFSEIMVDHLQNPGPRVVVNSWGMYSTAGDAPAGNAQNYARNPRHPFNQIVGAAVGSGMDVVFAAGNCGGTCPSSRCGNGNTGPGSSIHGANSHPEVLSVAAVTVNDDLLGYSSEGPGGVSAQTPDIAGFSHFDGSGVFPVDSGTSAACPVVGGVVAALRSSAKGRNLSPDDMKSFVIDHARSVHGAGWSAQFGWGIVDADTAFAAMP